MIEISRIEKRMAARKGNWRVSKVHATKGEMISIVPSDFSTSSGVNCNGGIIPS